MSKKKPNKKGRFNAQPGKAQKRDAPTRGESSRSPAVRPLIVLGGVVITLALLVVLMMNVMNDGTGTIATGSGAQSTSAEDTNSSQDREQLPPAPVEFDPPQVNFGDVMPNTEHRESVQVRNTGNRTLEILTVNSSCPCTTTHLDATEIPPGGSVPFELVMDSEDNPGTRTVHGRILFRGYQTARVPIIVNVLDG